MRHYIKTGENIWHRILSILGGKIFQYGVLVLFFLQGAWIAISFRYPMLFDERYHVGVIGAFSKLYTPWISHQLPTDDYLGNLAYSNASLYHYIMSFIYRVVSYFTHDFALQVITLRLVNVLMVTAGLWVFILLLRELKVSRAVTTLSVFFYSMIPLTTFVAATINYDNMIFLVGMFFFYRFVKFLQTPKPQVSNLVLLLVVGMFASLIKFTFLPVFAVGMIIAFARSVEKRKYIQRDALRWWAKSPKLKLVATLSVLFIFLVLFSQRYLTPLVKYHSPIPQCAVVLNEERCAHSDINQFTIQKERTKQTRTADKIYFYINDWFRTIEIQLDTSASTTEKGVKVGKALPVIQGLMIFSGLIGLGFMLYGWRSYTKTKGWHGVLALCLTIVFATFAFNALSYYQVNEDINTQARYLLLIFPVYIAFALSITGRLWGKKYWVKIFTLTAVLFLCTQGGGVVKPILNADKDWYWHRSVLIRINTDIQRVISPLVIK